MGKKSKKEKSKKQKSKKEKSKKEKSKKEKKSKKQPDLTIEAGEMTEAAKEFLKDVEKSGEKLAGDVKYFFEHMADNATKLADTAAKTTASASAKVVAGTDPTHDLARVMEQVAAAGDLSMRALSERFDALRKYIADMTPRPAEKEVSKAAKKPSE